VKITNEFTTLPINQANFVGVLAALTHGILEDARTSPRKAPRAEPKRSLFDRLDTWLWRQEAKNREAFLAESTDIVDLEQRQRWLERGRS
jgi:hypothetical protein